MDLFRELQMVANTNPFKVAVIFNGMEVTYKELVERTICFSEKLGNAGIKRGERVCVILANGIDYIVSYYGTIAAGCIVVPVNVGFKREEIRGIVDDCSAEVIVSTEDCADLIAEVVSCCNSVKVCIVDDEVINVRPVRTKEDGIGDDQVNEMCDVAAVLYTSGTTSCAKGAMLSHENLISNALNFSESVETNERDVHLCMLPMSHSFAATVCMNMPLLTGATLIVAQRFSPSAVAHICTKYNVTTFAAVPSMFAMLNSSDRIFTDDVKTVKRWISGGAALPKKVFDDFENKFKSRIQEGYGLTEASPVVCVNRLGAIRKGSVGQTIPEVELRIVDDEFNPVLGGSLGQIIVGGKGVMKGYFNTLKDGLCSVRDGWLSTGDVGKIDEDGYLYVVDRIKDMINVSGSKVYPREVENVLLDHPCVENAIVFGVPDDLRGEQVAAQIVLKDDAKVSVEDVRRFCRDRLAGFKTPHHIQVVDEIKLSPSGKPMRELAAKGFLRDLAN